MFIKTLEKLDEFIRLHNPYYAAYKQMRQLKMEHELESEYTSETYFYVFQNLLF
jgi:hypothetical protein